MAGSAQALSASVAMLPPPSPLNGHGSPTNGTHNRASNTGVAGADLDKLAWVPEVFAADYDANGVTWTLVLASCGLVASIAQIGSYITNALVARDLYDFYQRGSGDLSWFITCVVFLAVPF